MSDFNHPKIRRSTLTVEEALSLLKFILYWKLYSMQVRNFYSVCVQYMTSVIICYFNCKIGLKDYLLYHLRENKKFGCSSHNSMLRMDKVFGKDDSINKNTSIVFCEFYARRYERYSVCTYKICILHNLTSYIIDWAWSL